MKLPAKPQCVHKYDKRVPASVLAAYQRLREAQAKAMQDRVKEHPRTQGNGK